MGVHIPVDKEIGEIEMSTGLTRRKRQKERVYTSPSVIALIENSPYDTDDPIEIIRLYAREKVERVRGLCMGPPFDLRLFVSMLGIKIDGTLMAEKDDAFLTSLSDGRLHITFNTNKPETRRNYSIAHEVVHTFFPDYREQIQMRRQNPEHRDKEVEKLCEIGAAEILLPNPEFHDEMESVGGVGISSFEHLRKRFIASREATANRMVDSSSESCAVIYYKFKMKPSEIKTLQKLKQPSLFPTDDDFEKQFLKKLRVDYSISSSTFPHYIPRHKSLDEDSPLVGVAQNDLPFKGVTGINLGRNEVKEFYVEATSFPCDETYSVPHGVIAFVFPTKH